jgi:hypothetical protein
VSAHGHTVVLCMPYISTFSASSIASPALGSLPAVRSQLRLCTKSIPFCCYDSTRVFLFGWHLCISYTSSRHEGRRCSAQRQEQSSFTSRSIARFKTISHDDPPCGIRSPYNVQYYADTFIFTAPVAPQNACPPPCFCLRTAAGTVWCCASCCDVSSSNASIRIP